MASDVNGKLDAFMATVVEQNPGEPVFHQAVGSITITNSHIHDCCLGLQIKDLANGSKTHKRNESKLSDRFSLFLSSSKLFFSAFVYILSLPTLTFKPLVLCTT